MKPQFRQYFETDIINNLKARSNGFTSQLYMIDIMNECVMYACDMCLEFNKKSDGLLSQDWIEHITNEVCEVFFKFCPNDFTEQNRIDAVSQVTGLMINPVSARTKVDIYYNRI